MVATSVATRTDADIQRDVLDELKWDARVQPNEIGVVVKNGIVTLTGWVDSYTKKWAAEEAALRVKGAKAVANDIEVRLRHGGERTDSDIARAAVDTLKWKTTVPDDRVKLSVSKGWVTVEGDVDWNFQRDAVEEEMRYLTGVRGVINEITVVGSRCGRFAPALQALETRRIEVTPLIAAQLPLNDGVEGLRGAAVPGTLKVLLRP